MLAVTPEDLGGCGIGLKGAFKVVPGFVGVLGGEGNHCGLLAKGRGLLEAMIRGLLPPERVTVSCSNAFTTSSAVIVPKRSQYSARSSTSILFPPTAVRAEVGMARGGGAVDARDDRCVDRRGDRADILPLPEARGPRIRNGEMGGNLFCFRRDSANWRLSSSIPRSTL